MPNPSIPAPKGASAPASHLVNTTLEGSRAQLFDSARYDNNSCCFTNDGVTLGMHHFNVVIFTVISSANATKAG